MSRRAAARSHRINNKSIAPSVGIVVIGKNDARFLPDCLASVCRQRFKPDEIVYFDDGSDDDSAKVAGGFAPVKVLRGEVSRGMCMARVAGMEATKSRLLLFVDSDNKLPPDYLFRMVHRIEEEDAEFVYPAKQYFGLHHHLWRPGKPNRASMWKQNYADTCSLMRRETLLKVGNWRDNVFNTLGDWDLFLRMTAKGHSAHAFSGANLHYRAHENNASRAWNLAGRSRQVLIHGEVRKQVARISVIITYGGRLPEVLGRVIAGAASSLRVANKLADAELIVMNDTPNGFPMELAKDFPTVSVRNSYRGLLATDRRPDRDGTALFLAATCNDAIQCAMGDVLWFLEDDTVVPDHAASLLLWQLLQSPDAPRVAVAGCYNSRHHDELLASNVTADGSAVEHLKQPPRQPIPIQLTGTGCLMVLRDLLGPVKFRAEWRGGNGLRTTGHDWSFCQQLWDLGTPVLLVPEVHCRHYFGPRADDFV